MIRIIADTLSCISLPEAKELGLAYIPQIIEFEDRSYRDDTEMDSATFITRLRAAVILPKTSAPPPALYAPFYQDYSSRGDTILVIAPTSKMSGTVRSAQVAAQDFPTADIHIIDTGSIGSGLGMIVRAAVDWVHQGMDIETIEANIVEMASRERILFVVDTLEYLQRGGRIGKARAVIGSLLQLKPILTINDGQTEAFENQRTQRKALHRIAEIVQQECPQGDAGHLSLMHGDIFPQAQTLAEQLKESHAITDIPIYNVPPAILVHSGPGVIGISYFRNSKGA